MEESVKTSQGKKDILFKKMKYEFTTSLQSNLQIFKSSLFEFSIIQPVTDINLMSRILSGDPDVTWDKMSKFITIDNTITNIYNLATIENKNLIFSVIKSEIKSHPDYPVKLFQALTGSTVMSSIQNYNLSLKLTLEKSNDFTNYHTCFNFVEIKLPLDFSSLSEKEKKDLIILAIGYDAVANEINRKINQQGGVMMFNN